MANLTHAELVTPERILFSGDAESVMLRADGGDTTFLANHADYIASVDVCVVRIEAASQGGDGAGHRGSEPATPGEPASQGSPGPGTEARPSGGAGSGGTAESTSLGEVRAAVHGGFVKVAANKVTVIAGVAELGSEIDVERARRALAAAEGPEPAASGSGEDGSGSGREGDLALREAAAARARARLDAAGVLA